MDRKTEIADSKTTPSNEALAGELQQMRAEMRYSLEKIKQDLALKQDCERRQKGSKTALTVAFGAIGAKIFGVIGFKAGAIHHLVKTQVIKEVSFANFKEVIRSAGKIATDGDFLWKGAVWTVIAGSIGAFGGALLGWNRGDRIDKPTDLFTHPIQSAHRLFGPAPKNEVASDTPDAKNWRDKISSEQAEQGAAHSL